jgi:hypothetical protein
MLYRVSMDDDENFPVQCHPPKSKKKKSEDVKNDTV